MSTERARRDILLVALQAAPLDRIRLMKTAFLVWHKAGRPKDGPFHFEPYLYGPCAFDLYAALSGLLTERLVARAHYPADRWTPYHLTPDGRREAEGAERRLGQKTTRQIQKIAAWAEQQSFRSLLDSVYKEAPDFAVRSILRVD